jgi:hypothetical protein
MEWRKRFQGLATNDFHSPAPSPKVEQCPLAGYAALEEVENNTLDGKLWGYSGFKLSIGYISHIDKLRRTVP